MCCSSILNSSPLFILMKRQLIRYEWIFVTVCTWAVSIHNSHVLVHSWSYCEPPLVIFPPSPSSTPLCTPTPSPKISKAASAIGNLQRPDKAFPSDFHTFLWPLQEIHSPGYLIKCWLAPICTRTSVPKLYQLAAVSTSRVYMVNAQGVFTPNCQTLWKLLHIQYAIYCWQQSFAFSLCWGEACGLFRIVFCGSFIQYET